MAYICFVCFMIHKCHNECCCYRKHTESMSNKSLQYRVVFSWKSKTSSSLTIVIRINLSFSLNLVFSFFFLSFSNHLDLSVVVSCDFQNSTASSLEFIWYAKRKQIIKYSLILFHSTDMCTIFVWHFRFFAFFIQILCSPVAVNWNFRGPKDVSLFLFAFLRLAIWRRNTLS